MMRQAQRAGWHFERRTKHIAASTADGVSGAAQDDRPTLSRTTSSADEMNDNSVQPGAYAVHHHRLSSRRRQEENSEWDPTDQINDTVENLGSQSGDLALPEPFNNESQNSTLPIDSRGYQPPTIPVRQLETFLESDQGIPANVSTIHKRKVLPHWSCFVLFLIIVSGVTMTIVRFVTLNNKSAPMEEDVKATDKQENPICSTGNRPSDPFSQCAYCLEIKNMDPTVKKNYDNLMNHDLIRGYFLENKIGFNSCDSINVAAVWVVWSFGIAETTAVQEDDASLPLPPEWLLSRFALANLYASWNGNLWTKKEGWLGASSVCQWYGVSCNNAGSITSLYFSGNAVQGDIEKGLVGLPLLSHLTSLDLSNNTLEGEISPELWKLSALENLNLSKNPRLGPLSDGIANLASSLTTLNLGRTMISGSFPEGILSLTNLVELHMSTLPLLAGMVSGERWDALSNLMDLDLSGLDVIGDIPSSITLLSRLRTLDVTNSTFSGTIPNTIGNMTSLEYFRGSDVIWRGTIPSEFARCVQLKELDVSKSNFLFSRESYHLSGTLPTELAALVHLEDLRVSGNVELEGSVPTEYRFMTSLQQMHIHDTHITGIPEVICQGDDNATHGPIVYADVTQLDRSNFCSCCELYVSDNQTDSMGR